MTDTPGYAELAVTSNFSFLRGASHPQDYVLKALELGYAGIGITDRNTVAGVVRAYSAIKEIRERHAQLPPLRLVVGARLVFTDDTPDILAYPENRDGWGRLCRLLSFGKLKADKGECILTLPDLLRHLDGLLLIVMPDRSLERLGPVLDCLAHAAPDSVWLASAMHHRGNDQRQLEELKALAIKTGVPLIATNDVLYHDPGQRDLQDVVTCIREGITIENAGKRLQANAERHLKAPGDMARLFANAPEAVAETTRFLEFIEFDLGQLQYDYPEEPVPPGKTPQGWLEELTWHRARNWRYPNGIPDKVEKLLREELALIAKLDYARYFLTIHDIVRYAEDQGILCQGRGSAANSAVCYALGITAVDPAEHDLLFARFISVERQEPPDIDVDFEHERREEVIQHIYERYGRERAGIAATVISYRPRSAIREVGKVFGLTEDITARLAGTVWGNWGSDKKELRIRDAKLDPTNPAIRRAVDMAGRLLGFPRHLSQHVGGFVLTRTRLDETVPIGNAAMDDRTFIEWDKDDIDELGLMKVDVLALGMLTCIRKCFDLMRAHCGQDHDLASIKQEDPVYEMLQKGDSIGVFQVESRAQINMLPRLRPKEFYDLVIQVAIVRPGPIQGDMVHPYLRRRNREEDVDYPSPKPPHDPNELRNVLKRTLGVPLFQEQAMKIAMVAADFSPEEANGLRRAMATFRHTGTIHKFEKKMIEGMEGRGYEREFAERCFNQIKGFGEYGFPESHAASFAKLVYVSAWIKCHHPAVFACGLLNAQPMGFYAPAQIVRDAREHGVEVRPVDVNHSHWDNTLEHADDGALALRLGFRQVDGFREDWAEKIVRLRNECNQPIDSIETLWHRARLPHRAFKLVADADGFRSTGLDRRRALWAIRRLPDDAPLPLFASADERELGVEPEARLPEMPLSEHVIADYQTVRLSLKAHPMAFLREKLAAEKIVACADLAHVPDGTRVLCAGVVLIRQRPGTGNAIFMTIEDETGIANALIWARRFEKNRPAIMGAKLAVIAGQVQKSPEGVIHIMTTRVYDRSYELDRLANAGPAHMPLSPCDGPKYSPNPPHQRTSSHPRNARIIPRSRDFH